MDKNIIFNVIQVITRRDDEEFIWPLVSCSIAAMEEFSITTPRQIAAFLAQCAHESAGFKAKRENLNYSAQGLANTWGRFSKTGRPGGQPNYLAEAIARNPMAIACNVYANRMGNGDDRSGDGWRYRGGGWLQLTGRDMYRAAGEALGVDLEGSPEQVEEMAICARASAWCFAEEMDLLDLADDGNIDAVSNTINTGSPSRVAIGQTERRRLYGLALQEFGE